MEGELLVLGADPPKRLGLAPLGDVLHELRLALDGLAARFGRSGHARPLPYAVVGSVLSGRSSGNAAPIADNRLPAGERCQCGGVRPEQARPQTDAFNNG